MSYLLETKIASLAVKRASNFAHKVASLHDGTKSITKEDHSPVTVADFGAQAIIIGALKHVFPNDNIVGEEDAGKLRQDENLREKVWNLVKQVCDQDQFDQDIGHIANAEEMMDLIDQGNYSGGPKGRMWALDPIDGTKGFIRKGQYAVCLALIEDCQVVVGTIGCPNLAVKIETSTTTTGGSRTLGSLFTAVQGEGAFCNALFGNATIILNSTTQIHFNHITDISGATFCESVEAGHSSHRIQARIAEILGITKPSVRMDSQAKYCSISRGDGDIYLRLPVNDSYQEKIWDHAAGNLLVTEAGGRVSDMHGRPLNFGVGRTLAENKGVIASRNDIHDIVLQAVKQALDESHDSHESVL